MSDATNYFLRMGIPDSIVGFDYLMDAMEMANRNVSLLRNLTKQLYPKIAEKNGTTWKRVERGIRFAIETAWERGDCDFRDEVFSYSYSPERGRPSNAEFISRSYRYLAGKEEKMVTMNEVKDGFLTDYKSDLLQALPNDEQAQKDIDDLVRIFSNTNLDDYVVRSFVQIIGDAIDDQALTSVNLRRYLNALRAAL